MGVCTKDGVVGIVRDVSEHFSTVMSVLNRNTVISTRLSKSNHFGELHWDGKSKDFAQLKSVEKYVPISVGDSLVTNSYSSIFPEGISIGTVNRFEREETENFYAIEVNLSVDFTKLHFVYVIKDAQKAQRVQLESKKSD
jgi:rod shape-determining protein MreC